MSLEDVEKFVGSVLRPGAEPTLHGWCTLEKGKRMAQLASGARLCVELGVFGGRGLISLAATLKDQGYGEAHGVDPFTAAAALEGTNAPANNEWWSQLNLDEIARSAQVAIDVLGLSDVARIIRSRSQDVVDRYEDESVDVLHQDSNHSEEVSCSEVELWTPKVRSGGYWIFDDTDWSSTARAQAALLTHGFAELEDHGSWKVYRKP